MKAVIMAGGEGTRLRPLTCNRPKPMVPIANKPVMEHIIELLKKHNFKEVAITLQYLPELIKEHFGDGRKFGMNLKYYIEESPLGTAGSVKNAEEFLDETFLVISGDALTDIDLSEAIAFHKDKGSMATLVLKKVDIPLEYGVVVTDKEGRVTSFLEKPSWGEVFSDTVNTGIYILSPMVFKYFKRNEIFDFSKDLFPILLKDKIPIYGYVTESYWCDIGDLKAYSQAHLDVLDGKVKVNILGNEISKDIWIGNGSKIDQSVVIQAPCIIGENNIIKEGTVIGSYSVVGDYNILGERNSIKRGIVWGNCIIDKNAQIRGSVLCNKVHLKDNCSIYENSVIGENTLIKNKAIIKPNIKVWPDKIIETNVELNSNLVWGSRFTRTIFGNRGITGRINVDITPEYASKLGAAYGAIFKEKGKVGISCDDCPSSQMLKISMISGMLSSGLEVFDCGRMLLPVTRSAIRFYKMDGGIHINACVDDTTTLFVDVLDKFGSNIDRDTERKIETAFIREDFKRCEGDCIKEIKYINGFDKFYIRNIINNIKSKNIGLKIALSTRSKFISESMFEILNELGCEINTSKYLSCFNKPTNECLPNSEVRQFSKHIRSKGFDLGIFIEDSAEKMLLIDEKGRIITDDLFIALVTTILFKTIEGGTVIVPISTSHVVEKIAEEHNGKVLRTKTSHHDFMKKLISNEVKEEMLDQFTMHFDAMAGFIKILDFMSSNGYKLSELVDLIPQFYVDKKEVECPWDAKGRVIRNIIQENDGERFETLEGVKIYKDNGWVLVLPDAEEPICRVISEGYSEEFARELSDIYVNKVREISRS